MKNGGDKSSKTKRNSSIELLRIFAMLGIGARHSVHGNDFDVFKEPLSINKLWLEAILNPLGKVGMVIFFTISVWFLCDRTNTLSSCLRRVWIMEREILFWSITILLFLLVFPAVSNGDIY